MYRFLYCGLPNKNKKLTFPKKKDNDAVLDLCVPIATKYSSLSSRLCVVAPGDSGVFLFVRPSFTESVCHLLLIFRVLLVGTES